MKPYHTVWLADHPERTDLWLKSRLHDGFDIHHYDHNHDNNEPKNLLLIERVDHHKLHRARTPLSDTRIRLDAVIEGLLVRGYIPVRQEFISPDPADGNPLTALKHRIIVKDKVVTLIRVGAPASYGLELPERTIKLINRS